MARSRSMGFGAALKVLGTGKAAVQLKGGQIAQTFLPIGKVSQRASGKLLARSNQRKVLLYALLDNVWASHYTGMCVECKA